jgi:hypothetical protein
MKDIAVKQASGVDSYNSLLLAANNTMPLCMQCTQVLRIPVARTLSMGAHFAPIPHGRPTSMHSVPYSVTR